tara:strand:- start:87 stop:479 length:393 start_codon:yes stop_codon:yes gene_type:complete
MSIRTVYDWIGMSTIFGLLLLGGSNNVVLAWGNTGHPERHTLSLACDLETFKDGIKFDMNYKDGVIQFVGDVNKIPIVESASPYGGFDFPMYHATNNRRIVCNIVMPSGSLMCSTKEGNTLVGFCLVETN